jgi:Zn-dependent protease
MPALDLAYVLRVLSVALIPGLFAITVHEVAHGWVAKRLGDPTAYMLGRLTLNPLKHVDLLGTVAVPILAKVVFGGFFGWAKPVPVAYRNLKNPKRDMVLVAAAGPGVNLLMATGWALLLALLLGPLEANQQGWFVANCTNGIQFNLVLMVFNLIPIPPLDGGRVLSGLLPRGASNWLDRIEPYGFIIVLLGVFGPGHFLAYLFEPPFYFFLRFFERFVAGLA